MSKRKVQGMGPLETPEPMKTSERQAAIQANMERCPRFERCNRNQCPLDAELELRYGGTVCFWMQDGPGTPVKRPLGIQTYVPGVVMPDELLVHVPGDNISRLNDRSHAGWITMPPETGRENAREGGKRYPTTGELGPGGSTVT